MFDTTAPQDNRACQDDINCRDTTHLVSLGRDGEISTEQHQQLLKHIAGCERCQVAKVQFEKTFLLLDLLLARPPEAAGKTISTPQPPSS